MEPTSFDESNHVLGRPREMTDDQCGPLSVFVDGKFVVSCWKMTTDERQEFLRTGRVWLMVVGQTMPPVILTTIKPLRTEAI